MHHPSPITLVIQLLQISQNSFRDRAGGGSRVATTNFENWNLATSSASLFVASLPSTQPGMTEAISTAPNPEWAEEAVENLRHVGRGVVWALTIEGAAALCAYVLWQLL
jgi:hypothetical protein